MERVDWKKAYKEFVDGNKKNPEKLIQQLSNTKEEIQKDLTLVDELKVKLTTEMGEIEETINFIRNK